jgi:hypothetical protein
VRLERGGCVGKFVLGSFNEDRFVDENKDFHGFVMANIPAILDLLPQDVAILHEFKNIDFVCVDKEGGVYLLECKLNTNPEIKRKVISQLIDYAVTTFDLNYEEILSKVENTQLKDADGFDSAVFNSNLKNSLTKNILNLYIVSNDLPDELIKAAMYISVGTFGLPIRLVEIKRFIFNNQKTAYIRTLNDDGKETVSGRVNLEQFISSVKGDTKKIFQNIICRFKEKYPNNGVFVGERSGSLIFKLATEERNYTIFVLNGSGLIGIAGYKYLRLDKDFLSNYYSKFKEDLKLESLMPKDMVGDSACYRVIKENPNSFLAGGNLEIFYEFIDKLIDKLLKQSDSNT